jgi:epoxyqueuosine reductase
MDRGKCITNISCFSKDVPKEDIRSKLGLWLYGCDACQDACPLNKDKFNETEEFPLLPEFEEYLKPENILKMDEETYINILNPRF